MRVIVAGSPSKARALADALVLENAEVLAVVAAASPAEAAADAIGRPENAELLALLARADLLVVEVAPDTVTAALVAACDRFGVRIVARCSRAADRRWAAVYGLRCVDDDDPASVVLDPAAPTAGDTARPRGRTIVVWGPAGAPGRTTIAIDLAAELARDGRRVALIDADSHAPSVALATGLADEGPGFAAACRQAARGSLTPTELTRICASVGDVSVLVGINRPARWPELSAERVAGALAVSRQWADDVVVDVSSSLEHDEEIMSDLDGPRRNAATLAALGAADMVVAVVAADPVSMSRFIRVYGDLRAAAPGCPVRVLINKTRSGAVGIDPRGQLKRTLERYTGVREVWYAPWDGRAVDAALLNAQPVLRAAGRSSLAAAIRRFVGEAIEGPEVRQDQEASRGRRRSRRRARRRAPTRVP